MVKEAIGSAIIVEVMIIYHMISQAQQASIKLKQEER
jgi:hypothetical protein